MNKKKILIVVIPTIILILIAVVVTIAVMYVVTDSFKSYDELFAKYFSQNEELLSILKNEAADEQRRFKQENSYISNGELNIDIQEGTNNQTITAVTSSRHNSTDNRTYSEIVLKNGESDLIKLSYINSTDVYAIKYEDVLANYIGIRNSDLKTFARNMGVSEENIKNIPDTVNVEGFENLKITDDEIKYIENKYFPIIIKNISKNKYTKSSKNQISVDGVNYTTNAYTVSIDNNTLKSIANECLNTLKEDDTIYGIINRIAGTYSTDNKIEKNQYVELINNIITKLEQTELEEGNIKVTIYEYKGTTIRTLIDFYDTTKICIDKLGQEKNKKVLATIEQTGSTSLSNITNGETETDVKKSTMQISIEKVSTETETVQKFVINPNTNNMTQKIVINTSLGKNINGNINNSSIVSITTSDNGANTNTIESSYDQSIQVSSQIEDIMELKNSNTVIVNNYTKEQLIPFLQNIGNKAMVIVPNKLEQLGINFNINQDLTANTSFGNNIIEIIASSSLAIANTNAINIDIPTIIIALGMGMNRYNQSTESNISSENELIKTYNSMYDSYEGIQKGSAVKVLLTAIKSRNESNKDDISKQVTVKTETAKNITEVPANGGTDSTTLDNLRQNIDSQKEYEIDFGYDSNGYIIAVGIIEQQ